MCHPVEVPALAAEAAVLGHEPATALALLDLGGFGNEAFAARDWFGFFGHDVLVSFSFS
jgi:hypothetical protein